MPDPIEQSVQGQHRARTQELQQMTRLHEQKTSEVDEQSVQEQLRARMQELQQITRRHEQKTSEVNRLLSIEATLNAQLTKLNGQREMLLNRLQEVNARCLQDQGRLEQTQQQVGEWESHKQSVEAQVAAASRQLTRLKAESARLEERNSELSDLLQKEIDEGTRQQGRIVEARGTVVRQETRQQELTKVSVSLEGRMPILRQEVKRLSSVPRKLITKDGLMYELVYVSNETLISTATDLRGFSLGNVVFANADSPEMVKNIIASAWDADAIYVLAFTKPKVFNQPHVQNLIQSMGSTTRFGMVVEDEPEKITLSQVEAALKEWLPVWSQEKNSEPKEHPPYLAIRHRLSDETNGRLDATKIAKLFGLSMAEMGTLCGVSKQSVHANPTSKGMQEKLEPLVKAARGVLWCGGDESKFKTWLNQPNPDFPEYEGRQLSPLDLIRMGHAQVIADKVQNLLTGHPA